MNPFLRYLRGVAPLCDESAEAFASCVETRSLPKSALLLAEGQVCHHIWFVEEGVLRLFYHRDDRDVTDYFGFPGQLMGGIDSFFSQQPSRKAIQTIESCRLHGVRHADLERLYQRHHDLEHLGRRLATEAFLSMQRRLYSLQFHTARQRYDELLATHPTLLQRVPLGHIASFLGVTQVTLSRIRAQRT